MPRLPQNVLEIQVSLAVERSILVLASVCRPVYPQYAGLQVLNCFAVIRRLSLLAAVT